MSATSTCGMSLSVTFRFSDVCGFLSVLLDDVNRSLAYTLKWQCGVYLFGLNCFYCAAVMMLLYYVWTYEINHDMICTF